MNKEDAVFSNGYALLIGVGADLPVTVKDATSLSDLLVDPKRAAYMREQVYLLTETGADRSHILGAFDELITQVEKNPEASVIVYFSGHGGRIERIGGASEYFLVPYGYEPSRLRKTTISGQEFTDKIEAIKAKKLVVLLDCCHAGGIPALKAPGEKVINSSLPAELLNALEGGSGRVVIASSHDNEYSYTGVPYSVFTSCLVEALQGKGTRDEDGFARILDVMSYLFKEIPSRTSGSQHPFVNKVLDLSENFPLCYYAGGSKYIVGNDDLPASDKTHPLSEWERQRLLKRRVALQEEWELCNERLRRLSAALRIETDIKVQFKLEHDILSDKDSLAQIGDELREVEQALTVQ